VIVFFCNPYHSWEKGTVENRNRAVRRYAPKKTNLSTISIERFKEIETILRTRYMKCLNFLTPQEAWDLELKKAKTAIEKKVSESTISVLSTSIIHL